MDRKERIKCDKKYILTWPSQQKYNLQDQPHCDALDRLLRPSDQRSLGSPQQKLPMTHTNQLTSMDTSMSQHVLGTHRSGSYENLTKPISPATSKLSLRSGSHSSLAKPRNSLPNHLSPSRSPTRDPSLTPKDRVRAERCRSPRKFDSVPLTREFLHQLAISWDRGEHFSHSNPPSGSLLQNDNPLPSPQVSNPSHLPTPAKSTYSGIHNPNLVGP